jgi:hypothetical protein
MSTMWAQRREELLSDCLVSPEVFTPLIDRLVEFVVPYQHALGFPIVFAKFWGLRSSVDRLFDAFYTTKPGGMGMGLSICRSLVEAHGSQIWAARTTGPGATVQFTLPVG